ncbi:MAG: DUF6273 domain-containing protein [Synergistaceae bacterium]|nr:DUF6273 domain-containing protein [Synergistaceae bacterium]
MKKIIILALAMALALSLTSFGIANANAKVGDKIQLGGIDWLVLAVEDGKTLIISEKILELRAYNSKLAIVTWETCTLREYLNNSFYEGAFSSQEKDRIAETKLVTADNPKYETPGGNDTTDKIFLLSGEEAEMYLPDQSTRVMRDMDGNKCFWWLRSPGKYSPNAVMSNAAAVYSDGEVSYFGYGVTFEYGVRPALWLNQ